MAERGTKQQGSRSSAPMVIGLIVVVVVAAALGYYAWLTVHPRPVPIGDILADLRTYNDSTVTVRGEVVNTFSVLEFKTFDLDDGTGQLKVITSRGMPKMGETITVKGIINEVFNIAGVNYTVLMESGAEP